MNLGNLLGGLLHAIANPIVHGVEGLFGQNQAPQAPAPTPAPAPQANVQQLTQAINQSTGFYPSIDQQIQQTAQAAQQQQAAVQAAQQLHAIGNKNAKSKGPSLNDITAILQNPNGPLVGLAQQGGKYLGQVSQGAGNALQQMSTQSRMASSGTPVLNWLENNISDPMAQSFGSTMKREGQLEQGQNPYHGTAAQVIGQIGEDALNTAQVIPGAGEAEALVRGAAKTGAPLLKQMGKGFIRNVPYGTGYGLSSTLENNDTNIGDLTKAGVTGGLLTGSMGAGAPVIGKVLGGKTPEIAPEKTAPEGVNTPATAETPYVAQSLPAKTQAGTPETTALALPNRQTIEAHATQTGVPQYVATAMGKMGDALQHVPVGRADEANGLFDTATDVGKELQDAIGKYLKTDAERQQLRDLGSGGITIDQASPKVRRVAQALEPLNKAGLDINQSGGAREVNQFFHREMTSLKTPEGKRFTGGGKGVIKSLFDPNLKVNERKLYKFVSPDGDTRIGTSLSTGMKKVGENEYQYNGKSYSAHHVTELEAEKSGVATFRKNGAELLGNYHRQNLQLLYRERLLDAMRANGQLLTKEEAEAAGGRVGDEPLVEVPKRAGDLAGLYVPQSTLKDLMNSRLVHEDPVGAFGRAWQGITRPVVQNIVFNPLVHGSNQESKMLFQGIFAHGTGNPVQRISNMVKTVNWQRRLASDENLRAQIHEERLRASGGEDENYGENIKGFIVRGADKVNPKFGTALKASPKAMAAEERNIRDAAYAHLTRDQNMTGAQANSVIRKALGSRRNMGQIERNMGMFTRYLTHNLEKIGEAGVGIKQGNFYPVAALAMQYAIQTYIVNFAWKEITGNPDASVRAPGVLGTAEQVAKIIPQLHQGRVPTVVTSHLNPFITYGVGKATSRDLSKPVFGPGANANNTAPSLAQSIAGPWANIGKVAQGKTSIPETLANLAVGAYTPHETGHQAAPNLGILNTSDAKDGTGMDELRSFQKGQQAAYKILGNDQDLIKDFTAYISHQQNDQGQTVLNDPQGTRANATMLLKNPKLLEAVQAYYKNQSQHDPKWDQTDMDGTISGNDKPVSRLEVILSYEADYTKGQNKAELLHENPWLGGFLAEQQLYYHDAQFSGNVVQSQFAQDHPYPKFDDKTQALITQFDDLASIPSARRTTEEKNLLTQIGNNPDYQAAILAKHDYDNAARVNEHAPTLAWSYRMTPQEQAAIDAHNKLPVGTGARSHDPNNAIIKAAYSKLYAADLAGPFGDGVAAGPGNSNRNPVTIAKEAAQIANGPYINTTGVTSPTDQSGIMALASQLSGKASGSGSGGGKSGGAKAHLRVPTIKVAKTYPSRHAKKLYVPTLKVAKPHGHRAKVRVV